MIAPHPQVTFMPLVMMVLVSLPVIDVFFSHDFYDPRLKKLFIRKFVLYNEVLNNIGC
jgi:hypothetical protein